MKILIDTNILISTILWPESIPAKAYHKAVSYPNEAIVCEQNIEELRRIFDRKFKDKLPLLEQFITIASLELKIVSVAEDVNSKENMIRDVNDRPILRCAIQEDADILLTGDRDFLESGITDPHIMTAREFLESYE